MSKTKIYDELIYVPIYKNIVETAEELEDPKQVADLYQAIARYYFWDEIPTTEDLLIKALFNATKPNLDTARKRYLASKENGKKGGAPKGNTNSRKKGLTPEEFEEYQELYNDIYWEGERDPKKINRYNALLSVLKKSEKKV